MGRVRSAHVTLVEHVKYDATDPHHAPIVKQAN